MSSYKIIDSTISILYCAKCANEHLEQVSPGRLVCPDCGAVSTYDAQALRVGRLTGTKYKMRSKRRYAFREIIDEAREDAFREKFVPSPEPGRGRVGWRHEEAEDEAASGEVRIAGVDEPPGKGWRNRNAMDILIEEGVEAEDDRDVNSENGSFCGSD